MYNLPPPAGVVSGPPPTPPETPSLSAYPVNQGAPGQGAPPSQGGAIPKLVFSIFQGMAALAKAAPDAAAEIEQAKNLIRVAMVKAIRRGNGNPEASTISGVGSRGPGY